MLKHDNIDSGNSASTVQTESGRSPLWLRLTGCSNLNMIFLYASSFYNNLLISSTCYVVGTPDMVPYPEPYQSAYQQRWLGALGKEWLPSTLRLALGPDFSIDPDYQMLPLADFGIFS